MRGRSVIPGWPEGTQPQAVDRCGGHSLCWAAAPQMPWAHLGAPADRELPEGKQTPGSLPPVRGAVSFHPQRGKEGGKPAALEGFSGTGRPFPSQAMTLGG